MTLEEYKLYIEDYTKKSNYPDISKQKKIYNIAVVGLGQVGIYLLNELNQQKKKY